MKKTSNHRLFKTRSRPWLEFLEDRLTPTAYTVSSLADAGDGSLRAAITSVNNDNTPDEIDFSVAGVIQLTSGALPAITNTVKINGASAPNFANVPLVEIDNNGFAGLTINAPNSSLVSMSIVNANGAGVALGGSSSTVVGNYIGLALDGTAAANHGNGIVISSSGVTIGGTAAGAGNVISGNTLNGILVQNPSTTGTVIQGNFIGTNAAGSAAIGNSLSGVLLQTAGGAKIGGSAPGAGNVISGNKKDGVEISGLVVAPQLGALSSAATGSLLPGTYFYVVTATTAQGETTGSNEQSITLADPGAVSISWGAVPGAASYKIYRGTAAGQENVLVATVFSPATMGSDAGAPTTPGTPPLANTAVLTGLTPSTVQGNKIGTDVTGTIARGNLFDGIQINQAAGTTIGGTTSGARNLISGNGGVSDSGIGIDLIGASTTGTVIQGNFIGTDVSGGQALGNAAGGILLQAAVNNTIGAGNVISSNGFIDSGEAGIHLANKANNNTIVGNLIGTDVTGLVNLGNGGAGILIDTGSSTNTVGGTTTAQRNVISGNGFGPFGPDAGVTIIGIINGNFNDQAFSNVITGNFIGVDITGGKALGNCLAGVAILDGTFDNTIGGTATGAGNVISGNSGEVGSGIFGDGVLIRNSTSTRVNGNNIGVDVTGLVAVPNKGNGINLPAGAGSTSIGFQGAGNIISGNGLSGIFVENFTSTNINVLGNAIGVDATRTVAIPNQRYGVEVTAGGSAGIGGTNAGAGNVISGNLLGGVGITSFLPPPLFASPALGLGGALPAGTYFYVITATNAAGETTASAERTITLAAPGAVVLNWVAIGTSVDGATGYKIYRGTSAGAENDLVTDVVGQAMTSFTDAGGPTTPGAPPQTNTALDARAAGASLLGNTIGLNGAGTAAIPNPAGVLVVEGSVGVGANEDGAGNVISGNLGDAISISGSTSIATVVKNFIGTASDGQTPFPNGGNGVIFASGATTNTGSVALNVIQNNPQDGILVQTGSNDVSISANSIFNNGKLGIELQPGANRGQQAPVITSAFVTQGNTLVQGTVTGPANSIMTVQLFSSPSAPSTGPGQGKVFLEVFNVITDAAGQSLFAATVSGTALVDQFLTATASQERQIGRSTFTASTSEFSAGVAVINDPLASLTILVYQDVLNRPPSATDIHFWSTQLNGGVSRLVLAQAVWESAEHRGLQVQQYFRQYLDRAPDPAAGTFWVSQMLAGLSENNMQLALLTSAEFMLSPNDPELDHRSITDYVTGLYRDVLNRNPTPAEVQVWVNVAALGASRAQIAAAFLTSPEAYSNLLNTYYSQFLKRAPDPAGAAFFLNALGTGSATPQSVAETILASDEFFARARGS